VRAFLRARERLPLWARWVITICVYVVVIGVVVVVVHHLASEGNRADTKAEASAQAEANKEGQVAIAEDQAPHSASLTRGASVIGSLERAIASDVRRRIAHGELTGPLQSVHCARSGPATAFTCTATSAGIGYEFRAAANAIKTAITWCKVDKAPAGDAALEVPVSASCLR
jgi:hypothetical protein